MWWIFRRRILPKHNGLSSQKISNIKYKIVPLKHTSKLWPWEDNNELKITNTNTNTIQIQIVPIKHKYQIQRAEIHLNAQALGRLQRVACSHLLNINASVSAVSLLIKLSVFVIVIFVSIQLLKIKFVGYSLLNLLNLNTYLSAVLKTMDQGISYLLIVIVMVSHLQRFATIVEPKGPDQWWSQSMCSLDKKNTSSL